MSGLGGSWGPGQRRSQRTTQNPLRTRREGMHKDEEQIISTDPADQAKRWGTESYAQQVYGQQGMEGQGYTQAYHGTGASHHKQFGLQGVGFDEPGENVPLSQVSSEESTSGHHPEMGERQGQSQQASGGLFGNIGEKVQHAMGEASRKVSGGQ